MSKPGPGARQLAELFHDRYERLAPSFGYETRVETRAFAPASKNGRLMIAVCDEILTWFDLRVTADELARLRTALERIANSASDDPVWPREMAREALRDVVETTACTDDAPDVSDKMPEFAAKITRDAQRYHWLRKNGTHVLVGFLMREGDSLADLSPERLDAMIDRCLPENGSGGT